ncbi:U-box domain-containing protein [Actinidia chinensis var. chinensis]|uniref:U-box domain-containing protein n=1 Tax=Actinidia chinensis var. chinensis TaxID=1590841 RepID=A0A2R6QKM5_ACTCC|nr:U-box domain-containing protein [Actinidia chinensis var. chinensis]
MESRSFSEITSETDEAASFRIENFVEFSVFIEKSSSILGELKENELMDTVVIRKSVESLETELQRAKALMGRVSHSRQPLKKQIEEMTHDLGRSLGLVLFASHDVPIAGKEKIEALRREMMSARFDSCSESEFANDAETEKTEETGETEQTEETEIEEEIVEEEITLDIDDVVLQVKYGNDDEFKSALSVLNVLIRDNTVTSEWVSEEGVIPILFNRLGSSKPGNRITIIQILRSLASQNDENKEKMAETGGLTTLVKSLARDVEEQREAVGLLLSLSEVSAARRRIGRIQGCIIVLVAILNGDEPVASNDAGKLLNALSSNTQNALHMAEAGYFKPLVHYLKEGSDMSKILMATALSRMELTDQCKASLGSDGAIKPLVKMFQGGKLEAKLSSLSALQNLSSLKENIQHLITTGIVSSLLQLLFSVTSVLMTLREPASAILAKIAESESILVKQDVAQQMLSLLNLSSPVIQHHLLQALNSIVTHQSASKVRTRMKENGAIQLLLPFLTENNTKIRAGALDLIYTLSKDLSEELAEILGETHVNILINILSSGVSEREKAAAVGILSNLPVNDKKATDILNKANLLPILIPILSSNLTNSAPSTCGLVESIVGVLIQFTVPSDKKLQRNSVEQGVIPLLVKLLSNGSTVAKTRAAVALSQLSQNTMSLQKSKTSRWFCVSRSTDAFCEVHDSHCTVKGTFCLVKAGAISPMIQILERNERGSDEAVLGVLATLLQDEIWENGSNYIVKMSAVQTIIKIIEQGTVKAQEKALWILERIFRVEAHREMFGESAQVVLIDMAQTGDPKLKSMTAKILAQLELLQPQSSYF